MSPGSSRPASLSGLDEPQQASSGDDSVTTIWVLVLLIANGTNTPTVMAAGYADGFVAEQDGALACSIAKARALKRPEVLGANCTYIEFPQP